MEGIATRLRSRLGAAVAAVALLVAGGPLVLGTLRPAGAHEPPLRPLDEPDLSELDDGYEHFIVEIPEYEGAPVPSAAQVAAAIDSGATGLELLALLGDAAVRLVQEGGRTSVLLADGSLLPLDGSAPTPAADEDADDRAPAVIARLRTHDVVVDAKRISDRHWAVRTTVGADEFETIAAEAGAVGVAPDVPVTTFSNDPNSDLMWAIENPGGRSYGGVTGVEDADLDGLESRSVTDGAGVVVAVVDSGIQSDHPDMGTMWSNADEDCGNGTDDDGNGFVDDCWGWDFYNNDNTPYDPSTDNDHGTHVAGTIGAKVDNGQGGAGLAPGVTLMNVKALQNGSTWLSAAAGAVRYAVDNGADVINASWGTQPGTPRESVAVLEEVIEHARARGVLFVAAAGNSGADIDARPSYPAAFPQDNVMSIGASRADETAATFSNRGVVNVDLHAPGVYIVAPVDNSEYAALQGTSMAAPYASAAAAQVLAREPGLSPSEVRLRLMATVDSDPAYANLSASGGRLNAARAIGASTGESLSVSVTGTDALSPGTDSTIGIQIQVTDPGSVDAAAVQPRVTILAAFDGQAHGVVGLPVTVDGSSTTTDTHAQVNLGASQSPGGALANGVSHDLTAALPAGLYALSVELGDPDDPQIVHGESAFVFFSVTDPSGGSGGGGGSTPPPDSGGGGGSGGSTPPPDGGSGGGGGGGSTPPPDSGSGGGGGGSTPPPDNGSGGGGGGSTPPPDRGSGGGGGGSTPPPSGGGGGGSTPPPDSGSGGGGGGSTPPPDSGGGTGRPDPVTNDGITLSQVSPTEGPTSGGTSVHIWGLGFPDSPRVSFGGTNARVTFRSTTLLIAETPAHASGLVDVTVSDASRSVTMPRAFRYLGDNPSGGGSTPPPSGGSGSGGGGGGGSTPPPDSGGGSTPPPSGGGGGGGSTPTTTAPAQARTRVSLSSEYVQVGSLTLARVVANNPIPTPVGDWHQLRCTGSPCTARPGR